MPVVDNFSVTPGFDSGETSSLASTSITSTVSSTSTLSVTAPASTITQSVDQTSTNTGVAPSTPSPTCGQTGAFNISVSQYTIPSFMC